MKNKEIEELLDYYQKEIDKYEETKKYLMEKYGYDEETIDNISQHQRYKNNKLLLSYIEQLENTIDDMTNISYKDYDSWLKNKDYVKDLESFANQINYDMHPTTTLAYRTSIKNAIQILVKRLKETYTEDTVNELKQENKQLQNNRDKAIEYVESHFIFNDKTGECYQTYTFDKDNVKKLYDILKGDSDYD